MVRVIRKIGDDVLRKRAHPVANIDRRTLALMRDMADTMYAADGCGLAAPQIGILRRIVVIDVGEGLIEMINPVIISREGSITAPEGCLSIPGRRGLVDRPEKVVVSALNRKGEAVELTGEGMLARAMCHEIDHLDGQMYVDIMLEEIINGEDRDEAEDQ